ncbi:MAG: SsrA-binding protein [Flavobacteriales bacterium]|nr:SsrA-binding protein [Flavobacteriales bacterium]
MRRAFFLTLARLNKLLLPKVRPERMMRLGGHHKLLLAWRYWVTRNALD